MQSSPPHRLPSLGLQPRLTIDSWPNPRPSTKIHPRSDVPLPDQAVDSSSVGSRPGVHRVEQGLVAVLVLVGVGLRECGEGSVERVAATQVSGDRDAVAGRTVRTHEPA